MAVIDSDRHAMKESKHRDNVDEIISKYFFPIVKNTYVKFIFVCVYCCCFQSFISDHM